MTNEQKIIKNKLGLLKLADHRFSIGVNVTSSRYDLSAVEGGIRFCVSLTVVELKHFLHRQSRFAFTEWGVMEVFFLLTRLVSCIGKQRTQSVVTATPIFPRMFLGVAFLNTSLRPMRI